MALHGRKAPGRFVALKAQEDVTSGGRQLLAAGESSYPASIGGNKEYEYISSFKITPQDGYYKITVIVICPLLCDAEGYPGYGNTEEFVNVWIDWDGDYQWSSSEMVMSKSSANYKKILADNRILYFETTVKDVSTVCDVVKARAMLGYGYNPTDPTTYAWTWGDVQDVEITFEYEEPELYGFSIGAFAENNGGDDFGYTKMALLNSAKGGYKGAVNGVNKYVSRNNAVIAGRKNYLYPRISIKASEAATVLKKNYTVKISTEWNGITKVWTWKIAPMIVDTFEKRNRKYNIYRIVGKK